MLINYFTIAWRNITRHKAYSALNIAGLSIGMACSVLILLWVQNERSFDWFHPNADRIYRLTASVGEFKAAVSPAGMAEGLQREMPEIKATVRLSKPVTSLFEVGNNKFEEKRVFFADSNFLKVFSFPLIKGNANTAMQSPSSVLITEDMAKKYYGNEDALGKVIRINNNENFTITGILANVPANSHLQFDFIIPMATLEKTDGDLQNKIWDNFNFYTYLQLNSTIESSPVMISRVTQNILKIYRTHQTNLKITFQLQPLTDIHLYSNLQVDLAGHGNVMYVNILFIVAIFILAVACINFMNLATARSARRAKEVGLRKVVGAERYQIILQFLGESLVISFVSLLVAIVMVALVLPSFNALAEKELTLHLLHKNLWLKLIAIAGLTGLISGSYPALFLSGFNPIRVLKGKMKVAGTNQIFRNSLVVMQFVVAIILLVGTGIVYQQLNYIKSKNLGYEKSNLLYVPMTGDIYGKQPALKNSLQRNPLTANFSVISDLPTTLITGSTNVNWEGKNPDLLVVIPTIDVDENFNKVFKTQMLTGRNFSKDFTGDSSSYVINETAMHLMGMNKTNVLGKYLSFDDRKGSIIGVIKDFNFKSLQYTIEPLALRLNKYGGFVMVRTQPGNTEATLKALEKISQELNPSYPFTYSFLDKDLDNLYHSEQQMKNIFNLFAVLAIFISCLGLYGLSAFMAEQRTKEIGVRKVLGASVLNIVYLLSGNFTRLIVIAMAIAIPVSWITVSNWLKGFAYRIDINWMIFLAAALATLIIACLTVSYESVKAAISNPIKSLRTE